MEPIPELRQLRGEGHRFSDIIGKPDSPNMLENIQGHSLEIIAEFENIDADSYGLEVWRSEDGSKSVPIVYHVEKGRFGIGRPGDGSSVSGQFRPLEHEKTVRMHLFIDQLVVEAYLNKREYIAYGSGLRQPEELGLSMIVNGGTVRIRSLEIWEMNSCYKQRRRNAE
jgi:sucrose-6-phosphate hydrolase SacC (GH32 family)